MTTVTDPAPSPVDRVEQWFNQHSDVNTQGIDDIRLENESVVIYLENPIDTHIFRESLESESYEVENLGSASDPALVVYKVVNNSGVMVKVGSIYRNERKIVFDDVEEPVWSDGEVAGDVVEETLLHLAKYLEHRYSNNASSSSSLFS